MSANTEHAVKRNFLLGAAAAAFICVIHAPAAASDIVADPETLFVGPGGKEGCWVSFFAGQQYEPPAAQLTGRTYIETFSARAEPADPPALKDVGGQSFIGRAKSIVVGPHAKVVGYSAPWFDNPTLTIEPGRRIPDLAAIGFHEQVRSLKVLCEP